LFSDLLYQIDLRLLWDLSI